jgi:hypothetical protein
MGVDETERAFLARQINEDARQNGVLEDVGEIAGVKGVAIIDGYFPITCCRTRSRKPMNSTLARVPRKEMKIKPR